MLKVKRDGGRPMDMMRPRESVVTKIKRSGAWYRRAKRERVALADALGLDPNQLAPAKRGPKPDAARLAALRGYLVWLGEPDRKNLQFPQEQKHRVRKLLSNPPRTWLRRKPSIRIVKRLEAADAANDPIGFELWQKVRDHYKTVSKKTFWRDVARIQAELWLTPSVNPGTGERTS